MIENENSKKNRWTFLSDNLHLGELPIIVDIGANPIENPAYKKLLDVGLCKVIGFEPQTLAFESLQEFKGPNEQYENYAVGDGRKHKFHIHQSSGLSSFFELDQKSMSYLGRPARPAKVIDIVEVETHRLDDIKGVTSIDLLKIDVQGSEVMIFENASNKLLQALVVITELRFYPLYKNEPLLDRQIEILSDYGFRFHKLMFVKHQHIGNTQSDRLKRRVLQSQALDGDAVFVRDLRNSSDISSEKLKSLAILSDAVLESYDLTLHCLDLLADRGEIDRTTAENYVTLLPSNLRRNL